MTGEPRHPVQHAPVTWRGWGLWYRRRRREWGAEAPSLEPSSLETLALRAEIGVRARQCPPHVSRDTVAFLGQHDVKVMDCPVLNADMNPIEHAWDQISIWSPNIWSNCVKLSTKRARMVMTLVESMPCHVRAVLAEDTAGEHALSCAGCSR